MNDEGKKSFYAVNLTEGRMFAIFIGIVIVLVAIFFTIFVTALKLSKPKSANNLRVEKIETQEKNIENKQKAEEFSFYTDLAGGESVKQDNVLTKEVIKVESTNADATSTVADNSNIQPETEPQVSIDNTEVLYSSRYQQTFKKEVPVAEKTQTATKKVEPQKTVVAEKKPETNVAPAKTETKTENKVATKSTEKTKTSERYVVQIGSYTNKSVADEIANHYTKGGYPVYQQEFSKDGKTFYRLRVGPFKEKDRAENYLISIKGSKYGKNSYISKIYI